MIIVVIRAFILYIVVLVSMRIMGKGELRELQPFDIVVTLMIAELAVLPMEDLDAPLIHGIIAIVTLMTLQVVISFINLKSNTARRIICGKPSILIDHGKFNLEEMKHLRVNVNDIVEQVRSKGYESIRDIDYLIMETNGDISIIAPNKPPLQKCNRIPISVILDGEILKENITKFNLSKEWIISEVEKNNLKINDIIYGFLDENDVLILHRK